MFLVEFFGFLQGDKELTVVVLDSRIGRAYQSTP